MTAGTGARIVDSRVAGDHIGRLNREVFATRFARQLDIENPNSFETNDRKHRVVTVAGDLGIDRNDSCLTNDRCQFILHAGADARITVQQQFAISVQLQRFAKIKEILSRDSVNDLASDIVGAVVAATDVNGSAISGAPVPFG